MNKYKYAILIIIITIVVVVLTTLIIYNMSKLNNNEEIVGETQQVNETVQFANSVTNNVNEVVTTSTSDETKISPNALLIFDKYYKGCKHTLISRVNITDSMVNLTQTEFEKLYSDWKVIKFTSTEIELYKEFEGECGEHYMVKENNGYISIYKIETNGDLKLVEDTEISTSCLPSVDIESLKQGVTLIGKEELNAYLENFE